MVYCTSYNIQTTVLHKPVSFRYQTREAYRNTEQHRVSLTLEASGRR